MLKTKTLPIRFFPLIVAITCAFFGGSYSIIEARDSLYFDISPAVERVSPSVVTVVVKTSLNLHDVFRPKSPIDGERYQNVPSPVFNRFPRDPGTILGAGFFISADGYVVTNSHVVADGDGISDISVVLKGGETLPAVFIGNDSVTDLAVLKVKSDKKFRAVEFGDTDSLRIGERVFAIGTPLGMSETVTSGIVSARGRSDFPTNKHGSSYLQVDVPITVGNSGGPCFNSSGRLVGVINYAFSAGNGFGATIGFAIPTSVIKQVVPSLIKNGKLIRGWTGLSFQNLTQNLAIPLGIKDKTGVIVVSVTKDSPADKIGLKIGDVICEINGKPIDNSLTFMKHINIYFPKDKIEFSLCSAKGKRSVSLVLEASPTDTLMMESRTLQGTKELLGLKLKDVVYDDGRKAVRVVDANISSEAYMKGVSPGMYIGYINSNQVSSIDDVKRSIDEAKAKNNKFVVMLLQVNLDRDNTLRNKTWVNKDRFIDLAIN